MRILEDILQMLVRVDKECFVLGLNRQRSVLLKDCDVMLG